MLLDAHANVHATTRLQAITPLMMACMNGSAPMIELLLTHGAGANEANSLGTTALMLASASGSTAAVQALLDHGANPNATEQTHGQTALVFAASLDRADVISLLIAHKADPNVATKVMPIVRAPRGGGFMPAKTEDDADAGTLAEAAKEAPKRGGGRRQKPAADSDAGAVVEAQRGAGGHRCRHSEGVAVGTPARRCRDAEECSGIRRTEEAGRAFRGGEWSEWNRSGGCQGAGCSASGARRHVDGRHRTPLLFAARQGNTAAARALLAGGADVNEASGSEKTTPLVLAIANGHYDTARAILEAGADPNLANCDGRDAALRDDRCPMGAARMVARAGGGAGAYGLPGTDADVARPQGKAERAAGTQDLVAYARSGRDVDRSLRSNRLLARGAGG